MTTITGTPQHSLWRAPTEPPLERLLTNQGLPTTEKLGQEAVVWPTYLMVCSRCFEVQLWSYNLAWPAGGGIMAKLQVVNPGAGNRCVPQEEEQ